MSYWAALLVASASANSPGTEPLGVATWALQFTPRVAVVESAVVLEAGASLRLFGGEDGLRARIETEAPELGVEAVSWAPTSLGALALARSGVSDGFNRPLMALLDELPLASLVAVQSHQPTLARLGCRTLGDVRRLPRGGLSRRFGKELLTALDQAYGLRPEVHQWIVLPEQFAARLELPGRVETAPALMFVARRLLLQMGGWLAARHCGVAAIELRWCHDAMRSRSAGDGGSLIVRTGEPTRNVEHLSRLLAEHLAKVELLAPASDIALQALEVTALDEVSASLLPDTQRSGEPLQQVLERIAARLGPGRVRRPVLTEDHRAEWMQFWQPAAQARPRKPARAVDMPQPTWVLEKPLKLAVRQHRPLYQGVLHLLVGPHRIEGGWWHRKIDARGEPDVLQVQRDYWVALSPHAGALWIFQERLAEEEAAWYLHGVFA